MKGVSVLLKHFLNYILQFCRVIKKLVHLVRNKLVFVCHLYVNLQY